METPSSRVCTRIVWSPDVANVTVAPMTPWPQPLSCHPQPETPALLSSSRFIVVDDVLPIRIVDAPPESTVLENCAKTESLFQMFPSAAARIQRRYGFPASASNVSSK